MNVLMLNGSPRPEGNTFDELNKFFAISGVPVASSHIGTASTADCRERLHRMRRVS